MRDIIETDANNIGQGDACADVQDTVKVEVTNVNIDPVGDALTYSWAQTGGTFVTLSGTTTATQQLMPSSMVTVRYCCVAG